MIQPPNLARILLELGERLFLPGLWGASGAKDLKPDWFLFAVATRKEHRSVLVSSEGTDDLEALDTVTDLREPVFEVLHPRAAAKGDWYGSTVPRTSSMGTSEEKSTPKAIRAAARAGVFTHFHASENDRGVAGSGQVHWDTVCSAVHGSRYNRWVVMESFSQRVQAIRTAVSCWRPFYPSEAAFMKQGLRFVRRTFGR